MRPTAPPVDGVPQLPDVPTKDANWTKPARSLLLPDRFTFRGWRDDRLVFEVTGADIPDDITLGPDPAALGQEHPPDGDPALAWTGTSVWMVDFGRAVDVGLGVRVPLAGTDLSFDELFVVGISDRPASEGSSRLASTLRGHLYTKGLAFPPPDAPTNNTTATRSGWTTAPTMRTPAEVEEALAAARPGPDQPGPRVVDAFGIPDSPTPEPGRRDVLVAAGATDEDHEALTRRAHELLMAYGPGFAWPGIEEGRADKGWISGDDERRHYVELVRTRGPLATMRVGRQPYGVLPVTSLTLWTPTPSPDLPAEAVELLRLLRAAIARQLPSSPRIGRDRDQDQVLVDLLHRLPESVAIRQGQVGDREPERPGPHPIAGDRPPLDWNDLRTCTHAPLGAASLLDPALAGVLDLAVELIEEAKAAAAQWTPDQAELDFADQFNRLSAFYGPLEQVLGTEAGLFWSLALPFGFWGTIFACSLAKQRREAEIAGNQDEEQKAAQSLADIEALFSSLGGLVPDVMVNQGAVDRAIGRAIEALTSRVDAWATSVASARLRTVRNTVPVGLRLGAYGWLVDVTPTPPELRKADAGWVLTPSLQHAATTAVLHSGWAAHSDPEAFAVDLTSRRVRRAMATLAAIRDGRSLEELLGYQLERELHDAHLDRFIHAFRRDFPLPPVNTVDADPATTEAARRAQAERLVADGEAVRRAGPALAAEPVGTLETATPDELATIATMLAGLEETVDSMGDLLLAESVHQLVGGSPLRAGLAADTVGRAAPVPDRLDVVRTPRRTVSVAHAVALAVTPGSGAWSSTPRAKLDPPAEAVAAWALGDPGEWTVELTPADGAPAQTSTLATLGVAAIDVVVESVQSDVSEFARRVVHEAGIAGTVTVRRTDGLGGDHALPALAQAVRGLLATARPSAAANEVLDPLGTGGSAADLAELAGRVSAWWTDVQAALGAWPGGTDDEQRAAIAALAGLGLNGVPFGTPPAGGAVARERWSAVTLPAAPPPTTPGPEVTAWIAQLRADLTAAAGGWVLAAPMWTAADDGWSAVGGEEPDRVVDSDEIDDWLGDHRDACAGVTQLLDALAVAGACGAGSETWVLRQHRPATERTALPPGWVAVDHPGPRSATHLAALQIGAPAPGPRAVLVVDRWLDVIPAQASNESGVPVESASLAFRFDRPDARAPQAVLLAVPPDLNRPWCMEDVQAAVEETLWWAQARPLDADDLPELQWVLT